MRSFAQKLMMLAVVVFTASPIVDCCVTGHDTATTEAPALGSSGHVAEDTPPCHGGGNAGSPEPTSPAGDSNCSGCVNCDAAIVHANDLTSDAIVLAGDDVELLPAFDEPLNAQPRPPVFSATGPPRASLRAATTPLSLKQRLLI